MFLKKKKLLEKKKNFGNLSFISETFSKMLFR